MFTSTMNDAEIRQEARKDFFELSTKIRIALDRFARRHCDLMNNSGLQLNEQSVSLIGKTVESRKWRTRKNNTWTSYFRFDNRLSGAEPEVQYFIYSAVYRNNGTEYIFQGDLSYPVAERFTLHFIERYKERHLKPRGISTGALPVPLYFQLHNSHCIMGRYYKASDIDIAEGKHKRFWIAPEGIYVTDCIDGMLTYITFMDKDSLSPLKKQVYEEEIVWDLMLRLISEKNSPDDRFGAAYSLSHNPDMARIFLRFTKRNVQDGTDEEKQTLIMNVKKKMDELHETIIDAEKLGKLKEKEALRKNRIVGTLNMAPLMEEIDIKEYDINKIHSKNT